MFSWMKSPPLIPFLSLVDLKDPAQAELLSKQGSVTDPRPDHVSHACIGYVMTLLSSTSLEL